MLGIEFVRDKQTREPYAPNDPFCVAVQRVCREQGAMLRIQGNKMIISPPLVFQREHVDAALGAITTALETVDRR